MSNEQTHGQEQTHGRTASSGGGGFFSKLRSQAESALAKVPAYNELEHSLRQASVVANPRQSPHTRQLQLAIKGAKGLVIDNEALARESRSFSKNILDLGREENRAPGTDVADIQDVADRLAFLTYKHGELHADYAKKLEESRTCLKEVRNYENSLKDQRDRRAQLEAQIGKLRTASKPDSHSADKIADLQDDLDQLAAAGTPLAAAEAKVNSLRRLKLAESYKIQFAALQELGEKSAILASYGQALVAGWNVDEKTAGRSDYTDGERTAAVRSGVESALAAWSPSKTYIPKPTINTSSKTYAPSFHESHSHELASIPIETDPLAAHNEALDSYYRQPDSPGPVATAAVGSGAPFSASGAPPSLPARFDHTGSSTASAVPIPGAFSSSTAAPAGNSVYTSAAPNPTATNPFAMRLNNAPSDLPATGSSTSPTSSLRDPFASSSAAQNPFESSPAESGSLPTVAETGAPITGTGGPSSGVLRAPSSSTHASGTSNKQEEARQELNRRFEEYSGHSGDLERDMSMRGRREGESLPAYAEGGSAQPALEKSA